MKKIYFAQLRQWQSHQRVLAFGFYKRNTTIQVRLLWRGYFLFPWKNLISVLKQNIFLYLQLFILYVKRNMCLKCFQYEYEKIMCNYQWHRAITLLFFSLHFFHPLLPIVKLPISHNAHVYACVCMSVRISADVRESSRIQCNHNCSVSNLLKFSRLFRVRLVVVVVVLVLVLVLLLYGMSAGLFRHPGQILGLI